MSQYSPGELVKSNPPNDVHKRFYLYEGEHEPWDAGGSMLPSSKNPWAIEETAVILLARDLGSSTSKNRTFYKILTSGGAIGWAHSTWISSINV